MSCYGVSHLSHFQDSYSEQLSVYELSIIYIYR